MDYKEKEKEKQIQGGNENRKNISFLRAKLLCKKVSNKIRKSHFLDSLI